MIERFLVTVLALWSAAAFAADPNGCGPAVDIADPPSFQWTQHTDGGEEYYSGTLEMGEATFTIGGETLTTRAYRQVVEEGQEQPYYTIPGPTLNMVPGNKYVLRFKNTLPYEPLSPDHNVFKDPNATNLHTHGLHISGETPSDDVTRFFEGGTGGDFVYEIPADHMGGTFWYHAHHHGSTFLQVSSGAFGYIVIDDSADGLPANVANMQERLLLLGFLDPNVAGTGGDTLISGTLGPTWTANGAVGGELCVPPDTWEHWRVLLADRDARTKTVAVGSACEVALLARDGVWRTDSPLDLSPANSIVLTGASRADLAVRCSGASEVTIDNEVVATIAIDAGTDPDLEVHPYGEDGVSTWQAVRPSYLRDLRSELDNVNFETVSMGARTINGSKFELDTPTFTIPATHLQEWTIKGATNHPFHLHVYHMQAQSDCGAHEAGEFYDTIAANCDVRFDLNSATASVYYGRTIMHCHILAHEDQGAMGWAHVNGGLPAPTFPQDGSGYSAYYVLGGGGTPPDAPSSLTAAAVSSSQIDLDWTDNAADEDGFELERSLDGTNFVYLDTVGANTVAYSDTNSLAPSTTYWYRVRAVNGNGASDYSNVAMDTTFPEGPAATLVVESVTVTSVNEGKGLKRGRAVVVISDDQGSPVEGAVVTGDFTGTFNEPGLSGTTDAGGSANIDTVGTEKGSFSLTFCVETVDPPAGSTLDPYTGPEVCGSN